MREIVKKPWDYSFYEKDGKYYLFTMCGSVAVFEIKIELDAEEKIGYETSGLDYIDHLAKQIQLSPSKYSGRNLSDEFFIVE